MNSKMQLSLWCGKRLEQFLPKAHGCAGWNSFRAAYLDFSLLAGVSELEFRFRSLHAVDLAAGPQRAFALGRKGNMAKEICISSTPHETRLAILEDDQLAEIYYERENELHTRRLRLQGPGNPSSARHAVGVCRHWALSGDAFLYVTDFLEMEDQEDTDEVERASAQGNTVPSTGRQLRAQGPEPHRSVDDQSNLVRTAKAAQIADLAGNSDLRHPSQGSQILFQSPDFDAPEDLEESSYSEVEAIPSSVAEAASREEETESQSARRGSGRRRRRGWPRP